MKIVTLAEKKDRVRLYKNVICKRVQREGRKQWEDVSFPIRDELKGEE